MDYRGGKENSMKTNEITITVTVTAGQETKVKTHQITGETRRLAMDACKAYVAEFASKLTNDSWNVVPITKIDFSATKTIVTPQGDLTINTTFEARWTERKNKLVSAADEGFRSLTVGVKSRVEKKGDDASSPTPNVAHEDIFAMATVS